MDAYDGMSLCGGLVFFAPVALLVRTQAGISETQFFLLQALLSGIIALGELPTGHLTDRMGYRRSLILAQLLLLAARGLLLAAFLLRSLPLFVAEALVEGISACLSSGTASAYLYALYGESDYLPKAAHAANFGTAGFLLSTAAYALLYRYFGLTGLLAATVLAGAAGLVCSLFLRREPRAAVPEHRSQSTMWGQLGKIFRDRQALLLTALLSMFSVAWLLVNFFYAEKLADCGIPLTWLSAIIITYSAGQMLAEPIIRLCAGKSRSRLTAIFCLLCGGGLAAFGWLRTPWAAVPLMVLLPLLLDLASFYLEERQNHLIDRLDADRDRAAALSAMNIGVNLAEIASLFASSLLAALGIGWCFALCGGLLLLGALGYMLSSRKITG
ncbi:MAG: MFS transporter [Oscillibacter sp.]|jgi:hypothetical protein|nr:MFS transporter [Oscillibacter sp.]HAZ67300.1 hypothetical protein [Oscillibacter sp.]